MYYAAKCPLLFFRCRRILNSMVAKKEDDPEQALKEFKAIVDKEEEKGDWYTPLTRYHLQMN